VTTVAAGGLDLPPLTFLGRISYPLYLLHQEIGYVVMAAVMRAGLPLAAAATVAVLVALAAATAVTLLVDEPVRRALRHRLLQPVPPANGDVVGAR
jgi:peptidoglycan/LPS O-acetylase OafA/YrhL